MNDAAAQMRARLRKQLIIAMKDRDTHAVAALRTAIAAIDNAESIDPEGITATEVARRDLSAHAVHTLLHHHVAEYLHEADGYDAVGQAQAAAALRRQAAVVRRFLPG
jgi:uncharacterized protein YqeY